MKLRGQLGLLAVDLRPQGLQCSPSKPWPLPRKPPDGGGGRKSWSLSLTHKGGNLPASPCPSVSSEGPGPCSSCCILDNVAFAIQLDGFSDDREN